MRVPVESAARKKLSLCAGLLLLGVSGAAAEGGLEAASSGLGVLEAELGGEQQRIARAREQQVDVGSQLRALKPEREQLEQRLRTNARALYRISRGGMLPVAGGLFALLGHASRLSRLERLVQRDLRAARDLEAQRLTLQGELSRLESELQSAERQLSTLEAARMDAVREHTVHRSFEAALGAGPTQRLPSHAQYGLSVVSGEARAERFTDQRGNLALPVSGPSSIQDATRAESDGPGLEFNGTPGAAVRAAASGRVVFAESYGSYGKLVILDHGERHYSVYGGLAHLDVQVGDDLSKSARLGNVGSAAVYFEVRRGTKTEDARAWLGL